MPSAIRELADQFLKDPATVSVKPAATTAERVDQAVTFVNQAEKQALLTIALQDLDIDRALVFTRTTHGADRVVKLLAGNGIAATGSSHEFNFGRPNVPEQYVHRIGRTARAGASGVAISFCAEDERPYLRDIEKVTRQKITVLPLPADFQQRANALKAVRQTTIGADPAPREERSRHERGPARPRATHAARPANPYAPRGRGPRRGGRGGNGGRTQASA